MNTLENKEENTVNEFNERINPTTSLKVIKSCIPNVMINPIALAKMQLFVNTCDKEVGWLGTVIKNKNSYIIQDVYLFEQEVASTTTEITPEGLSKFAEQILTLENGVEIWNNIRLWGHSHVNMSVSPSGQDNEQMNSFSNIGKDWFIRIIANKNGDLKVDVYDYEHGIEFIDVPWERLISVEEEQLLTQINDLYEQINAIKSAYIDSYKETIEAEIKEKVKDKFYTIGYTYPNKLNHLDYNNGYDDYDDRYDDYNDYYDNSYYGIQNNKKKENKKETSTVIYKTKPTISKYNDIFTYFDVEELEEISHYTSTETLKKMLKYTKYEDTFTQKDLEQIIEYAKQFHNKYMQEEVLR